MKYIKIFASKLLTASLKIYNMGRLLAKILIEFW